MLNQAKKLQEPSAAGESDSEEFQVYSTQHWIDAARRMLIRDGIGALKVDRLAKECGLSRGGFYWRFKSREDLLNRLLDEWKLVNTNPLLDSLAGPGTPDERLRRTFQIWLAEVEFDPMFDNAVRGWAAASPKVAKVVQEVDEVRLKAFQKVYEDAGYEPELALVRARVTYWCQSGYYSLGVHESREAREHLFEMYYDVLTGLKT